MLASALKQLLYSVYKFFYENFFVYFLDEHFVDIIGTHDGAIKKAVWSQDGRFAISAGDDKVIRSGLLCFKSVVVI